MKRSKPLILAINGGSSSIHFALFKLTPVPVRVGQIKIDCIRLMDTVLTLRSRRWPLYRFFANTCLS